MRRAFTHEFVDHVPSTLRDGTVYVSIRFATAVHKCACGCGEEVVTPITPTDWQLTFDGETVSLHPSIGNWNLPCQSHYFIKRDTIQWVPLSSPAQIKAGRARDRREKNALNPGPSLWKKITTHFRKQE